VKVCAHVVAHCLHLESNPVHSGEFDLFSVRGGDGVSGFLVTYQLVVLVFFDGEQLLSLASLVEGSKVYFVLLQESVEV
jgi:hypothetical protein